MSSTYLALPDSQIPERSGFPFGARGAGAKRFGLPSLVRGIPGDAWFTHCAKAQLSAAICYGRLVSLVNARTKVEYSRLIKQHADLALKLDATDSYAWHVLGVWNYEMAKMGPLTRGFVRVIYGGMPTASNEEAARLLQKAVSLAPDRVSHHVELGRAYLALGMKDQARTELQRGLSLPNREKDDPESKKRATEALRDT